MRILLACLVMINIREGIATVTWYVARLHEILLGQLTAVAQRTTRPGRSAHEQSKIRPGSIRRYQGGF